MSPWARTAAVTSPISISEKYSGEPNFSAISAMGGPNMATMSVQTRSGNKRAEGCDCQGRTGAPLAGHLVAIDGGDDRRGFTG